MTGPAIFGLMIWVFYLRFTVPVLGVFYGTSLMADEVEDKTITYLFTRPIPRGAVLVGKYLAYLACTVFVVLPSVMLVYLLVVPMRGSLGGSFLDLVKDLVAAGARAGGLRGAVRLRRRQVQAAAADRADLHLRLGAGGAGVSGLPEAVHGRLLPAGPGAARHAERQRHQPGPGDFPGEPVARRQPVRAWRSFGSLFLALGRLDRRAPGSMCWSSRVRAGSDPSWHRSGPEQNPRPSYFAATCSLVRRLGDETGNFLRLRPVIIARGATRMTKKTRYFMAGSAAVLAAGLCTGLVAYYSGGFQALSASTGPTELAYVPADAAVVAYADVRAIMDSELRQRLKPSFRCPRRARKSSRPRPASISSTTSTTSSRAMANSGAPDARQVRPRRGARPLRRRQARRPCARARRHVEDYKGKRLMRHAPIPDARRHLASTRQHDARVPRARPRRRRRERRRQARHRRADERARASPATTR